MLYSFVTRESGYSRRGAVNRFAVLVTLIVITLWTGCASSVPSHETSNSETRQDPIAAVRGAIDDLVDQMAVPVAEGGRNIGVTPPEGQSEVSAYLQDEIIAAFIRARIDGLAVYERTYINELLQEADLGLSGLISEESAVEVGNMVGVDSMVVGSTRNVDDRLVVNTRVVDVETGLIIGAGSVSIPAMLLGGAGGTAPPLTLLDSRFEVVDLVLQPDLQPPPELRVHRITTFDGTWTEYNADETVTAQGTITDLTNDRFTINWTIPEGFGTAVFNYHRTPDSIVARIVVDEHEIGYLEFREL